MRAAESAQPAGSGGPHKESAAGEQANSDKVNGDAAQVNALSLEYELVGKDGKIRITARLPDGLTFERTIMAMETGARAEFVDELMKACSGFTKLDILDKLVPLAREVAEKLWLEPCVKNEPHEAVAPGVTDAAQGDEDRPQKDLLIELATKNPNVELFHTPGRHEAEPYASIIEGEHRETWPVFSKPFRWWLVGQFHAVLKIAPGSQPLHDAMQAIAAVAMYRGPEHAVFVRIAERDGVVWFDLGDSQYRAVLVTKSGWMVVPGSKVPVRFVRRRGMEPLPAPVKGGSVHELRALVNVPDDMSWILFTVVLVSYLWPKGPYVILIINGEQGSAKSTLCRFLRALIDPNKAALRRPPRDDRDLMIAATNGWIVALDNLSGVAPNLSDAICSLATGGGFATRELYSDADEKLFDAMRPVVLNGISDLATRPDLLDRAVVLTLGAISEAARQDEAKLRVAFERIRPRVLGALLDAVATALRRRGEVQLSSLPRMADFALIGAAAAPALGWTQEQFMDAYLGNRDDAHAVAVESSAIGPPIRELMRKQERWEGTAGGLLRTLESGFVDDKIQKRTDWPKSARGMREALARIAPNLRATGINVGFPPRKAGGVRERQLILERLEAPPPTYDDNARNHGEGRSWDDPSIEDRPAEQAPGTAETGCWDDRDDWDDRNATSLLDLRETDATAAEQWPHSRSKVREEPSPPSQSSQNGAGGQVRATSAGRSWDDRPPEHEPIVPPRASPNPRERDDGDGRDGPNTIFDQVRDLFGATPDDPPTEVKGAGRPTDTTAKKMRRIEPATPTFDGMEEQEAWQ